MTRFNIHSISVKMALSMLTAGVILLAALSFALPKVFYGITRLELDQQTSIKVSDVSIRLSYVLAQHNNLRNLVDGYFPEVQTDTQLKFLMRAWCSNPDNHAALLPNILSLISVSSYGIYEPGNGIVPNTMYPVLLTEQGDYISSDDTAALSAYLQDTYGTSLCERESTSAFYLPVFSLSDSDTMYFSFVIPFKASEYRCAMVVLIDFATIQSQIITLSQIGIDDYQLLCHDQVIYSHLHDSQIHATVPSLFAGKQFQTMESSNKTSTDYSVLCSDQEEGLFLVVHVPNETFLIPYSPFFNTIRILLAISILLLILISIVIVQLSLVRLKRLNAAMKQIQGGNYDIRITDNNKDEIGTIIRTTEKMLHTIQEETERTLQHEKDKKRMQYTLLVSAIDPHFIYNTLDIISFLASMGRTEDVITVNKALIGTLRGRMSMKAGRIFDTIAVERSAVEQYMTIQRYLCSNHIAYRFDVPDDMLQKEIPKNIIQPLVENAIKHGLLTHKGPDRITVMDGEVHVSICAVGSRIRIIVQDNGSGMSEESKKEYERDEIVFRSSGKHIGINNIRARLRYLYNNDYTIQIESVPDHGTTVIIEIPEHPQNS